jgi:hypothetical protein
MAPPVPLEKLVIEYVRLADELAALRGKYYARDGKTIKAGVTIEPELFRLLENRVENKIELALASLSIHARVYLTAWFENRD